MEILTVNTARELKKLIESTFENNFTPVINHKAIKAINGIPFHYYSVEVSNKHVIWNDKVISAPYVLTF